MYRTFKITGLFYEFFQTIDIGNRSAYSENIQSVSYRLQGVTPELKQRLLDYCKKEYGMEEGTPEEWEDVVYHGMKTEIHTMATLNDTFIGNIHRQLTTRHMHFTATEATEGCIPQPAIEGVLKVTILVFSVLLDDTNYQLTIRAR